MFYYAQYCPFGISTACPSDRLYRFESAYDRDHWVLCDNTAKGLTGDFDRTKRDVLSREEARRWYPMAFRKDTPQSFRDSSTCNPDYWDDPDMNGACEWLGGPTGGVYADM